MECISLHSSLFLFLQRGHIFAPCFTLNFSVPAYFNHKWEVTQPKFCIKANSYDAICSNAGINVTGYHPPPLGWPPGHDFFRENLRPRVEKTEQKSSPPGITWLKSGKKCLDPNLKNEITRSILKINKRFIAHFNRWKEWILNFQEKLGQLQNIDLFSKEGKI